MKKIILPIFTSLLLLPSCTPSYNSSPKSSVESKSTSRDCNLAECSCEDLCECSSSCPCKL